MRPAAGCRQLRSLFEGRAAAGPLQLAWDGRNDRGQKVGWGVYFVCARTQAASDVVRVVRF